MGYFKNHASIIGNLTNNPELKFTPGGNAICHFGVATNRSVKKDGKYESVPTFHNCIVWGNTAEWFAKNYQKGHKVCVEGRIENRSYKDKSGTVKYISEIVASEIIPMVQDNKKQTNNPYVDEIVDSELENKEEWSLDELNNAMNGEDPKDNDSTSSTPF